TWRNRVFVFQFAICNFQITNCKSAGGQGALPHAHATMNVSLHPLQRKTPMSRNVVMHDVLTLADAARYLRLPQATVRKYAECGQIPGRQFGKQWRFLRSALEESLGKTDSRTALLQQFGAMADDPDLPGIREAIYKARGRSETEGGSGN